MLAVSPEAEMGRDLGRQGPREADQGLGGSDPEKMVFLFCKCVELNCKIVCFYSQV